MTVTNMIKRGYLVMDCYKIEEKNTQKDSFKNKSKKTDFSV